MNNFREQQGKNDIKSEVKWEKILGKIAKDCERTWWMEKIILDILLT